MLDDGKKGDEGLIKKGLGKLSDFGKNLMPEFLASQSEVYQQAIGINTIFGQSNQRLSELQQTIFDIRPEITRLGGSMSDVIRTIGDVSEATKRNVLITTEDAKELFSAQKILGDSVSSIVSDFEKVGIQFSKIGDEFEKGMNYIQNLGLNTRQIFQSVTQNIEKLNSFNFANGIQGMSKMAANAAMFKFDMSETFTLAEKALSPEGAIELSSAFQRMGVAVGDLTDPFQLMYKSLNDPEGLQESLSQMTKKFTYFDEKTKTFKISSEGMLQMRELSKQTGISYDSLSKSSVAAANMDKALKQISPGIKFESEEDKRMIANIARMGDGGEYEVKLAGQEEAVKLSKLSQEQITELVKQQKDAPKTIEDTAKAQLNAQQVLNNEVHAIRETIEGYIGSQKPVVGLYTEGDKFIKSLAKEVNTALPNQKDARSFVNEFAGQFKESITKLYSGKLTNKEKEEEGKKLEAFIEKYKEKGGERVEKLLEGISSSFKTGVSNYKQYAFGIEPDKKTPTGTQPVTNTTTTTRRQSISQSQPVTQSTVTPTTSVTAQSVTPITPTAGQPISQFQPVTQSTNTTIPTTPSYQLPEIKPINQRPSVSNVIAKTGTMAAATTTRISTQNNTQNKTTNTTTTNNNQKQRISNTSNNNYVASAQQTAPQTPISPINQQPSPSTNQQPIQTNTVVQPDLVSTNVTTSKIVMSKPTVNVQAGPATISQVDLTGVDKQSKPPKEPTSVVTPNTTITTDNVSVYNDNKKTNLSSTNTQNLNNIAQNNSLVNTTNQLKPTTTPPPVLNSNDNLSSLLVKEDKLSVKEKIGDDLLSKKMNEQTLANTPLTKIIPELEKIKTGEGQIAVTPPSNVIKPIQAGFDQKQKKEVEEITANVNLGGNVRFEIVTTPQVDVADMEKYTNSPEFKNKFYNMLLNIDNSQRINIRNTLGIG